MTGAIDCNRISALIREAAATCIMPRFKNLKSDQIAMKSDNPADIVTIADREAEEFLTRELTALHPGSVVVGEEATAQDESIPLLLKDKSRDVWVLDPLDGTANFEKGSTTFCVMAAYVSEGRTKAVWIYDPSTGRMATAVAGQGAFIDGERISVAQGAAVPQRGFIGWKIRNQVQIERSGLTKDTEITTLGCAGHEYLALATGRAGFSVYKKIKPWDHLPGALLVAEAGGIIRKLDGSPYVPGDETGGIIAAANGEIWQAVRAGYDSVVMPAVKNFHNDKI